MSLQSLPLGHLSFCHSFTIVDTGLIQLPAKGRAVLNELVLAVSAAALAQVCTLCSITLRTLGAALAPRPPRLAGTPRGARKPIPGGEHAGQGPAPLKGWQRSQGAGRVRGPFPGNKSELEPNPFPLQITRLPEYRAAL